MKNVVPVIAFVLAVGGQGAQLIDMNMAVDRISVDQMEKPADGSIAQAFSRLDRGDYYQGANRPT